MDTSIVEKAQAGLSARRVFSDPIEQDGAVVVLAANVRGGGGGGEGTAPQGPGQGQGQGAGFGLVAKPAGAFLVRNGKVAWRPAIDVNRVILGGQLVAITGLMLVRAIVRLQAYRFRYALRTERRFARRFERRFGRRFSRRFGRRLARRLAFS